MSVKDEYGVEMHPWLFITEIDGEERYVYVPLESRHAVDPIDSVGGEKALVTNEECDLYDITLFLRGEGVEVTLGNANVVCGLIEDQEKTSLN